METTSFALGVASVLGAAVCTLTVWVTFRVRILKKENETLRLILEDYNRNLHSLTNDLSRNIHNRIDELSTFNISERDSLNRFIDNTFVESKKYTDSRIDKLIDAYFNMNTKKEVIKG